MLTKDEEARAASQGWSLCHVYDLTKQRWALQIFGVPSAERAGQLVIQLARTGDALAQKALRLIMAEHQGKK